MGSMTISVYLNREDEAKYDKHKEEVNSKTRDYLKKLISKIEE